MRLIPWDPDVETIISRIDSGALDLQPEFQRGEVWSKSKKQRLIDSILRDWHVPPLHVVENPTSKLQEVLDGQQRLAAIRDFYRGEFPVDGDIQPSSASISPLNGLRYRELPEHAKRQFDQFSLRVYRIVDFNSSEPAELFFRLNQPTNLTAAEQRNAFFGPVREQIKKLVDGLPEMGIDKNLLGFSNSRMAYDDVLCRVALTIKRGTLEQKIAANDLVELYRSEEPLPGSVYERLREALVVLGSAGKRNLDHPRFNKATLYSWLMFIVRWMQTEDAPVSSDLVETFADYMRFFESERLFAELGVHIETVKPGMSGSPEWLFATYNDRSTSRVADVSSVILRDVVIWAVFFRFINEKSRSDAIRRLLPLFASLEPIGTGDQDDVAARAIAAGWGKL